MSSRARRIGAKRPRSLQKGKSSPDESFFFTNCALAGTFNISSILVCPSNTFQVLKLGVFAVAVRCSQIFHYFCKLSLHGHFDVLAGLVKL